MIFHVGSESCHDLCQLLVEANIAICAISSMSSVRKAREAYLLCDQHGQSRKSARLYGDSLPKYSMPSRIAPGLQGTYQFQ